MVDAIYLAYFRNKTSASLTNSQRRQSKGGQEKKMGREKVSRTL